MKVLKEIRRRHGISQRKLAARAGISFRALQMLETGASDPRLSTLAKIGPALGRPAGGEAEAIESHWLGSETTLAGISRRTVQAGMASWKLWLFEFVDAFRADPHVSRVEEAPCRGMSARLHCLFSGTVETLCNETSVPVPWWCAGVEVLSVPWFVSGVENLKAIALVESPIYYRKRNVFVLGNFLARV